MKTRARRLAAELNAGSMADIAFLLLSFFMMTTVIREEKGLAVILPQALTDMAEPVHDRNVFTVQINGNDQFLVEGERRTSLEGVQDEITKFILNNGHDPHLSVSPQQAVVSLKTDRGTSYRAFIDALNEIQGTYYNLYAARAGISTKRFRQLDLSIPEERLLYQKGKEGIPMNISLAEPVALQE